MKLKPLARSAAIILALGVALHLKAQTIQPSPEALRAAADLTDTYLVHPNIVYERTNRESARLDVYEHKGKNRRPTLIYIHGGGWRSGPSKEEYALWFEPFLILGWDVINVEYRPAGIAPAPAAVVDCLCALRWVAQNAGRYHFDTTRIVVMGHSAGGHLALMAGMAENSKAFDKAPCLSDQPPIKVAAIVDWFGITDVWDLLIPPHEQAFAKQWIGNAANPKAMADLVSPITYVRPGLPPTIMIHGDSDPKVPYSQSVRLHDALTAVGVPNELVTIPHGKHGGYGTAETWRAYQAVFNFLNENNIRITP